MNPFVFRGWLRSRHVFSSVLGGLLLNLLVSVPGQTPLVPVTLNSANPRWELSVPNIGSTMAILIVVTGILPTAPEWEFPLIRRVRAAHLATWLISILLVIPGTLVATIKSNSAEKLQSSQIFPSSAIAFYIVVAGVSGVCVHMLGRIGGSLGTVLFIGAVVIVEQSTNWTVLLADGRHQPQWIIAALFLLAGAFAAYISGGHVALAKTNDI